jgi:glutathione S-transferase
MIAPMLEGQDPPAMASEFGAKYGYNAGDAKEAGRRAAGSLGALSGQLKAQYARGVKFFVGDGLSALDIYFTSFMNLLDPLPEAQCPMPEAWRPAFKVSDPQVSAAMDPILVEHRDRIFKSYFRDPMEF